MNFFINLFFTSLENSCIPIFFQSYCASIASALRNPEKHHLNLPSMNDLSEVCGLDDVLCDFPQELICNNFEATYSNLVEYAPDDYKIGIIND